MIGNFVLIFFAIKSSDSDVLEITLQGEKFTVLFQNHEWASRASLTVNCDIHCTEVRIRKETVIGLDWAKSIELFSGGSYFLAFLPIYPNM